jgi:CheY-like chemotaxis protein
MNAQSTKGVPSGEAAKTRDRTPQAVGRDRARSHFASGQICLGVVELQAAARIPAAGSARGARLVRERTLQSNGASCALGLHLPFTECIGARSMQLAIDIVLPSIPRTRLQSHKEHVLLIERDPYWADLASRSLASHGYRVTHMPSRADALEALLAPRWSGRACQAEVVLMDYDVAEHARAFMEVLRESQLSAPPVILLGSAPLIELMQAVSELGAADFVCKPFASSDLLTAVRQSLGRRTGLRSLS